MRRRLIVMRHAKSDWSTSEPDHDRPLAPRGRREATLAGSWLGTHVGTIDLVLCSSSTRTRQTWRRVARRLTNQPELRVEQRLYAASSKRLIGVLRELPPAARTVLLIGHNPGVEDLVAELTGVGRTMRTSSVAVLSSRGGWSTAGFRWARLDDAVTPRR